jgi:hypothetical protein
VTFISDDPSPPVFRDVSATRSHPKDISITEEELTWLENFYSLLELTDDHGLWFRAQIWPGAEFLSMTRVWNLPKALDEIESRPRRFVCIDEVCMKVTAYNALKDYPEQTDKVFNLIDRYLLEFHKSRPNWNVQVLAHSLHHWGGLDKAVKDRKIGRIELPLCIMLFRLFHHYEDLASQYATTHSNARSA